MERKDSYTYNSSTKWEEKIEKTENGESVSNSGVVRKIYVQYVYMFSSNRSKKKLNHLNLLMVCDITHLLALLLLSIVQAKTKKLPTGRMG